jgi:hypothetical protein
MPRPRTRLCPTCGCPEACYHDEHAMDEITNIPEEVLQAGVDAIGKRLRDMPVADQRILVEDIHRAMHEREPLKRRRDRDYTASGIERFK